jgi:hypothetical protein
VACLFTVLLGWWWMPRQLAAPIRRSILPLAAVGVGVGGWASFWKFEEGAITPVPEYALFAALTTVAYAAGLALWWWTRGRARPGLPGTLFAVAGLIVFVVAHAIERPLTLIGPVLVGVAVLAIVTTRPRPTTPARTAGPVSYRALWRLAIVPTFAVPVFAVITAAPQAIPSGWPFFAISVPVGAVLFVVAWFVSVRRRSSTSAETSGQPLG